MALEDPAEAFRYFWLIFRGAALQPRDTVVDGERRNRSFAEQLLDDSQTYAKQLGDRLKDRIFDEVFPHLAEGFLAHRGASAPPAQAELDAVFQGTLTLLYRLLFLLYAEARDLLPVKEIRGYHASSLEKLKQEVAGVAGDVSDEAGERLRKAYGSSSRAFYDRLVALFRLVDRGDASRNVPVYNGGLFLTEPAPEDETPEAENARFLLANAIPDRHLARGIDLLARDDDDKSFALVSIDYKSLGVRQLGSIYEGLLEFRLRLAPEKMAICKGKKTEEVVPYREAIKQKRKILTAGKGKQKVERTLPKGAVYLENDRRERKASGSYYTPDFVVEYIVAQTVGPVLDARFDGARPRLREAQKGLRREREKASALRQRVGTADDPAREAFLKHRDVVDALFGVTVLDPAMGSGHFLVEAVDYITDRLLDFLNGFPWNPVVQQLDETRQSILRELDAQGVTIDAAKLTDVNLLKRHVLKRCIYGVDLNPMAVELAKVSLWLDSFTLGAPLSVLDHHLKCGNSLLGARVEEVRHAIEGKGLAADAHDTRSQGSLFGSRFAGLMLATDLMRHVGELSDVTAAQVKQSRSEFRRASDELAPFKRILDLYTAQWLIDEAPAAPRRGRAAAEPAVVALLKSAAVQAIINRGSQNVPDDARKLGEGALGVTREKRVFHWELEFPEIFYSGGAAAPRAGFDAVVGNPPWIRQETIQSDKPALRALFANVFDSVADLYIFFTARAFSVLAADGRLGIIVPNKWQRAAYGEKLRRVLAEDERPVTLVDFGHAPIFPDADTFPCILIARHAVAPADAQVEVCSVPRTSLPAIDLPAVVRRTAHRVPAARLGAGAWDLEDNAVSELLAKIRRAGIPLRDYVGSAPLYGIKTGLNEAFLIDQTTRDRLVAEDPQCEPIIKKFLRGSDIQR
ncbi:MAG: Eco57I restriction-modification methylase domain-containing protein [bacterium]